MKPVPAKAIRVWSCKYCWERGVWAVSADLRTNDPGLAVLAHVAQVHAELVLTPEEVERAQWGARLN